MKNYRLFLLAALSSLLLTGCVQKLSEENSSTSPDTTAQTTSMPSKATTATATQTSSMPPEATTATAAQAASTPPETTTAADTEAVTKLFADNFEVDAESAAAYGKSIKDAVAGKDLEKLVDLTAFPVYVGFSDDGKVIETRESFLALGAERIFTEELLASIASADEQSLQASMAGFVLSDERGRPNIIFGVTDGHLAIHGINY